MNVLGSRSSTALTAAWGRPAIRNLLLLVLVSAAYILYVALTAPARLQLYLVVCASVAAVVTALASTSRWFSERTAVIIMVIGVQATLLSLRNLLGFSPDIGDARWVVEFASTNTVFPRWLGISYLNSSLYALGKTLVFTSGPFTWLFPTPEIFVRFFLGAVVLAQSVHLLLHTPRLRTIAFVVLSPFALLFLSGHIEIYMVVALFMVQCAETLRKPDARPVAVGAMIGVLGVLYYGAWHLCIGLLAVALFRRPTQVLAVIASFTLTLIVGIDLLWPGDVLHFANALNSNTPRGLNLLVPTYHMVSGPGMVWKRTYLFSSGHLTIVGTILFAGMAPFFAMIASALLNRIPLRELFSGLKPFRAEHVGWTVFGSVALAFVILMIPRLGLARDIDLFAISCVALVYLGGSVLEPSLRPWSVKATIAGYTVCSVLTFGLLLV